MNKQFMSVSDRKYDDTAQIGNITPKRRPLPCAFTWAGLPAQIDWDLIATHARDMIQVVLSIQAGRVMPSMLLRKLGTYNRKSLLYRAFRELGRVERTLFLLRFISSTEVRRVIRAETTKIETYNEFLDWICFGGPVVKSGDPVEQEKQLKYASLVANTVMLSNVADLTEVLSSMAKDGHPVTPDLV